MACRSASVQRAERKSKDALKAISNLEKSIEKLSESEEQDFISKIEETMAEIGVDDLKSVGDKNFATKVDFTHEFNADAMIPVITEVLNSAAIAISGTGAAAIISNPKNIKTFSNLLTSIAEALKTESTTGANTSFSVLRLAPGFFSFTSTKSKTISDKETFGEESITATTIFYALYFSKKHADEVKDWSTILFLVEMIRKMNEARVGLVDSVVNNKITMAEFTKLSSDYKNAIDDYESELAVLVNEQSVVGIVRKAMVENAYILKPKDILYSNDKSMKILSNATDILGVRSSLYTPALRETKELISILKEEI